MVALGGCMIDGDIIICKNCGKPVNDHDDEKCAKMWEVLVRGYSIFKPLLALMPEYGTNVETSVPFVTIPLIKEPDTLESVQADNHALRNELQDAKNKIWHLETILASSRAVVERQRLELLEARVGPGRVVERGPIGGPMYHGTNGISVQINRIEWYEFDGSYTAIGIKGLDQEHTVYDPNKVLFLMLQDYERVNGKFGKSWSEQCGGEY